MRESNQSMQTKLGILHGEVYLPRELLKTVDSKVCHTSKLWNVRINGIELPRT